MAIVALMTLLLVVLNRSDDVIPAEVTELSDTWKTIDHQTYGISFGVPIDWKISVFESGMGYVSGFFNDDTVAIYFNLDINTEISDPEIEDLLQRISPSVGEEINEGRLKGISYVGKAVNEGGYENESYVAGRYFIVDKGTLEAECTVIGQNYASYISTCDEVLKSIKKI